MLNVDEINKEILNLETKRDTTYAAIEKLAPLYIVRDHLLGAEPSGSISTQGHTVFERVIAGKDFSGVLPILCDLMSTLEAVNPVLYRKVIERLSEV